MKRPDVSRVIAGLAGGLMLVVLTAPAAGWNPFKNNKDKVASKYREQGNPSIEGRPLWSPVSKKYRWSPPEDKPSPVRRAVDVLTLKPLRTKSDDSSMAASANQWRSGPPITNTSQQKRSLFGSMFKSKPKKIGPQTMGEWMAQERPQY